MSPWYKIPRAGGAVMFLDHERADLEPADAPEDAQAEPEKAARRKPAKAEKPAESEAEAD